MELIMAVFAILILIGVGVSNIDHAKLAVWAGLLILCFGTWTAVAVAVLG